MLNFNLSKDDIGYLRLLIDIQSCDEEKNSSQSSIYTDNNNASKYSIYDSQINKLRENN